MESYTFQTSREKWIKLSGTVKMHGPNLMQHSLRRDLLVGAEALLLVFKIIFHGSPHTCPVFLDPRALPSGSRMASQHLPA